MAAEPEDNDVRSPAAVLGEIASRLEALRCAGDGWPIAGRWNRMPR